MNPAQAHCPASTKRYHVLFAGGWMLHYRAMRADDFDHAMRLWRSCAGVGLRDSDSAAGLAVYLRRNPGLSFVAELDGHIVGSVLAGHDGRRGYLQHLAVAREHRRRGIGSRLLALSLAALEAEGIGKIHVHVFDDNRAGREFWQRRGWQQRDEIRLYSWITGNNRNI